MPHGVGIGWRGELAADLLRHPASVDFVEVVAETCFVQGHARREAKALTELWPVVPHGVKLSLGAAEGLDLDRADRLAHLCRELGAPVVTEHLAFTRGGDTEIGHLTQLPRTRTAVQVIARNVAQLRRRLPDIPLLLENVAWSFRWPDDEMDEPTFLAEVVAATGCQLLLDVGNLYANARNEGLDPADVLARVPLDDVAMLHVAGGVEEHGFYFDTHAHAVPEAVFDLVEAARGRRPGLPAVLERDGDFPGFEALLAELERLRGREGSGRAPAATSSPSMRRPLGAATALAPSDPHAIQALAAAQRQVAELLTAPDADLTGDPLGIAEPSLRRGREILRRKRVDDALPLLDRLTAQPEVLRAIAERTLAGKPRARRGTAIGDALSIAQAASEDERTADLARMDLLVLRARFTAREGGASLAPRRLPFIGHERLSSGAVVWATKGLGGQAPVHLRERRSWT